MFLLGARRPGKYREGHHVRHGGTIHIEVVVPLPDPEDAALR